ncbi:MAG: hypothetical protein AAF593_07115 [Planctomycetota bacterium]
MKTLSAERYQAAVDYLAREGRPLDHALFRYMARRESRDAVIHELAEFQNADGGFGHSLEPDAVVAESSVLDTTHALQVLRRIKAEPSVAVVVAAMDYLRQTYDASLPGWPIRPFASAETPCAPWWKSADESAWRTSMEKGRLNPTAEVLGYFLEYDQPADAGLIEQVTAAVGRWIDDTDAPLESHELLCLARLVRSPGLSETQREAWAARIRRDVASVVNADPGSWDSYGLKPWWIAETPGDPMLGGLEPGLAVAMLDHEIGRQEAGGGWPPFWDWGGLHPEAWAEARRAWTSVLTEQMLRVLRAHGRLPAGAD